MESGKEQVGGGRADVDPNRHQLDVVQLPGERDLVGVGLGPIVRLTVMIGEAYGREIEAVIVGMPHQRTLARTWSIFGVSPYWARASSYRRWIRGSWSSYSSCRPPSLTLTSMPVNVFFLSSLNG